MTTTAGGSARGAGGSGASPVSTWPGGRGGSPDVGVPRDVFAQWAAWLDAGEPAKVAADLADLLAKTTGRPPGADPPSSAPPPPISTR